MALNRASQYAGRWNTPDADAPQGSGKNRTSPTSNDGSYFEKAWFDDMDSLSQALFIASGIAINGVQDVGTASQHFDALVNNRWSAIGNYSVGTIVTGSDGNQYYCNQANGRDTTTVNPVGDLTDVWRQYPYEFVQNSNGIAKKYYDGTVSMRGTGQAAGVLETTIFIDLPVPISAGFNITNDNLLGVHYGTDPNVNIIVSSLTAGETSRIAFRTDNDTQVSVMWKLESKWA